MNNMVAKLYNGLIIFLYPLYFICLFLAKVVKKVENQIMLKKFGCKKCHFGTPLCFTFGEQYFTIGDNCKFEQYSIIAAWDLFNCQNFKPSVKIGNDCSFGQFLHLSCVNKIIIGDNVLTGCSVTISDNNHGDTDSDTLTKPPINRDLVSKGPIIIGNNVWIGDKASILAGVTIGEGSVIGCNAVITKDVPPYSVAVGNPIRILKLKK